jgi:lipopolysaccharide transport system ATP-binding protein
MEIIEVKNLYKEFKIPHQRRDTLKENFLNIFKKNDIEIFNAIEDLSFSVNKGEFFGIIGRNGSGKSTLLKILANIYRPTKGELSILGKMAPFLELGVGFNLELTGRENVYLNGILLGLTKKEIDTKYDEIVKFAELERFMDQKLKNYSSGMQVRLAFSIAIQAESDIFILDEVLAVGDLNFQQKCLSKMCEIKKSGKTIVLVTHDLTVVKQFCDRVLCLKDGKNAGIGNTNEVIAKYICNDDVENSKKTKQIDNTIQNLKTNFNRFGNKKIEINSIEIINNLGLESNLFICGDKMEIIVNYTINEKINPPVFGMEIYDEKLNYCFATNTYIKKINTESLLFNNSLKIQIENIPFLRGKYYLTFAFQSGDFLETYDWIERGYSINITSNTNDVGFVFFRTNFILP